MKKYVLLMMVAVSSLTYAACDLCSDYSVPHKIYIKTPCNIQAIDEVVIIMTPYSVIVTSGLSADDQGMFYLTKNVIKVIKRNVEYRDTWDLCPQCGQFFNGVADG